MRQVVNGIYLPVRDRHFAEQVLINPIIDGKGTYQYVKVIPALASCNTYSFAVDVGANVGLWSRILAKHFNRVAAIEPIPENLECLALNVKDCKNVEIFPFAIDKHIGEISLKYMDDAATASVCDYNEADIRIPCKPLDEFKFTDVDFIKIDVEGYEKNVIESGEFTIRKYKPVVVVEQKKRAVKYDGYKFAAVQLLAAWGMTIAWENHGDYCMVWE